MGTEYPDALCPERPRLVKGAAETQVKYVPELQAEPIGSRLCRLQPLYCKSIISRLTYSIRFVQRCADEQRWYHGSCAFVLLGGEGVFYFIAEAKAGLERSRNYG